MALSRESEPSSSFRASSSINSGCTLERTWRNVGDTDENGAINADGIVTRAEAAEMIYDYLNAEN